MEDLIAEDLEQAEKPAFLVLPFLPDQFLAEIIAQKPAAGGERQCKLLGAADAFRRGGEKSFEQLRTAATRSSRKLELAVFEIGRMAQRLALDARPC